MNGLGSVIHDVVLSPLSRMGNEHGSVFRMLRVTDPVFRRFGEIYFSLVPPRIVKDWRLHRSLTMNLAVPLGSVRFVLFDPREESPTLGTTFECVLGDDNYQLLTVPNGIWMSFGNMTDSPALVANCATEPHDPDEIVRRSLDDPPVPNAWR